MNINIIRTVCAEYSAIQMFVVSNICNVCKSLMLTNFSILIKVKAY